MFGSLGMPELLFILVLALLVFGPKRLPQVGRTLGRSMREFRKATSELKRSVELEISDDEPARPAAAAPRATAPEPVDVSEPAATPEPAPESAETTEPADDSESAEAEAEAETPAATE